MGMFYDAPSLIPSAARVFLAIWLFCGLLGVAVQLYTEQRIPKIDPGCRVTHSFWEFIAVFVCGLPGLLGTIAEYHAFTAWCRETKEDLALMKRKIEWEYRSEPKATEDTEQKKEDS